jgi:hypothetical protein
VTLWALFLLGLLCLAVALMAIGLLWGAAEEKRDPAAMPLGLPLLGDPAAIPVQPDAGVGSLPQKPAPQYVTVRLEDHRGRVVDRMTIDVRARRVKLSKVVRGQVRNFQVSHRDGDTWVYRQTEIERG